MTILDRLGMQTLQTQYKRLEDPHPVVIEFSHGEIAHEVYNGYTYEQGFETKAVIKTQWFANQAQYPSRKEMAEKEMLYFIYGPIIQRFNELRARSADRDWQEVHRVLDELQKELVG